MKHLLTLTLSTLLLLISFSCGGGTDSLSDDAMGATSEFVELLEGIDSKEAAEAAAPKLKEVAEKMKALQAKMEALPDEAQVKMKEAMESSEEGKALQERMAAAMGKLMTSPELGKALAPIMDTLGE